MARVSPLIVLGAFAIAIGCAAKGGSNPGGTPTPTSTVPTPTPTPTFNPNAPKYHEDVQPIVYNHCQTCHSAGGVADAPPIDVYTTAATWASSMDADTAQRLMPPWPPEPTCRTDYKNERMLSATDVQTIHDWYMGGSQEGNPANAPTPTPTPSPLPSPSVVLDPGADFAFGGAGSPTDLYECFRLHTGIASGQTADMIRASVTPGNTAIVHHIILYREPNGASKAAGDMGACPGVPGSGLDEFLVGWVPGAAPLEFPADTGMRLADTDAIDMQVHYHNGTIAQTDRSTAALWFNPTQVTNIARVIWAGTTSINIPAGAQDWSTGVHTCTVPGSGKSATVLGLAPHMHTHGIKFHSDLTQGSTTSCLMDIARWRFEWQGGYMFQNPITIHSGDKITTQCDYQNVSGSSAITFGEGTGNEMCFDFFYIVNWPDTSLTSQFDCVN